MPGVWRLVEEAEDLKTRAERDASIFAMGYKPTARYIEETYGGEWEAVTPPEPPAAKVGAGGTAAQFAEAADVDPVDVQLARLAPAADAEIERMVETIQTMLDKAESLDEFRAMLEAAWPSLNSSGLADQLAEAMVAAELAGRAEVADGH